jgi:uncharacterized protein
MLNEGSTRLSDAHRRPATAPFKLLRLVTGQVLVREGDPPGAIYVVCAGRLRVFRRDLTAIDRVIDISSVGAGGVIGELGPILGQPRSATVQAVEITQVLEIPADQLPNLVLHHQPLLRVIALALRERTSLPDAEIAELAARVGLILPPAIAADVPPVTEPTQGMPVPAYDSALVYPKTLDCPSCRTRFAGLTVHPRNDRPAARDTDFHASFRSSFNPYDYELWVCPNDLYAALPVDFPDLSDAHRLRVAPTVEAVAAEWGDDLPEFNADRTLDLRQRALELALALYRMRELPQVRVAAITHRLAWCARERGDAEAEKTWLVQALDGYSSAYEKEDLGGAKEELRVQYLCGELSLRLNDIDGAATWFVQALRHPALKEHAAWERMLRERLAVARPRPATEAASA